MADRRRFWRSMRAQASLGATLVAGIALVAGAFGFTYALSLSVQDASARAGETRATEILDRMDRGGPVNLDSDDEIIVVLDRDGRVLDATEDAAGVTLPDSEDPQRSTIDGEPVLVVSEEDRGHRVLVAVPLADDRETIATVITLLALAVPLLAALVGAITWVVVGRALAPVTRIRSEVEDITADQLDRRVPVPPSGDEIAALAVTMNQMLGRLDAAAHAQRQFISDASHELRSPLATMRQHAELAQTHPEVTSVSELAGVIHDEGLRLQGLVDSLLLLARLDEGAQTLHESVDLDDLALSEISRLRASGSHVEGSGVGPARVEGDPRLLGQLVRNLADNAARHSHGKVAIGTQTRGSDAVLTVEDDGNGVPVEERERIFERFVRLDEARARDDGGSGLGLAIVQGIVDAAGGTVAVEEGRWGGARFVVTLPAAS